MTFKVDNFRSALVFDGARPNLFEVKMSFPEYVGGDGGYSRFMIKTAQLPGSTIGSITVPYFGREVKVAGNRTFAEWTVTIINDESFLLRNKFERWHRGINENVANLRDARALNAAGGPISYATDLEVNQYSKLGGGSGDFSGFPGIGGALKNYKFIGAFPTDIAAIDLDWGSNDTIEEFSVTFAYQYWTTEDGATSIPVPSLF